MSEPEPQPPREKPLVAIVVAISIVLLVPRALSELWMDELLTVSLFAQLPALGDVFRTYPIANNHILFSAIAWVWLKAVGGVALSNELILRLPSLVAVGIAVVVVAKGACRTLGQGRALVAAAVLGINPITQSLGWQFRGYGLTLMLGSLAVVGAIAMLQADRRGRMLGRCMALPALVLLPMAVPSNILLSAAIVILFGWEAYRRKWERGVVLDLLAVGVAAVVGGAFYLSIWAQFLGVLNQTAGWSSGWMVGLHWLVVLIIVFVPATVLWLPAFRQLAERRSEDAFAGEVHAKRLAVIVIVLSIAFALVKAPFPRTLVVFLPALILGAVACLPELRRSNMLQPLGGILVIGCAIALGITQVNERDRAAGIRRQNLLTQSYSGSRDWADITRELTGHPLVSEGAPVLVPFYDILTAQWYWPSPTGMPPVYCPIATGAYACPIPPEVLRQRPFIVISPPGDAHLAACSAFIQRPIQTKILLETGNSRVFIAHAVPHSPKIIE